MKKLFYYLGFVSMTLAMACCRPEVNDPRNFPTVDSFSPGIAKTGDTVKIFGSYLEGASVLLSGTEVALSSSSNSVLAFVVTNDLTKDNEKGVFSLSVKFADGSSSAFTVPILLNFEIGFEDKLGWLSSSSQSAGDTLARGPAQLLITDYDGHGVRTANSAREVADFDQTQFEGQVQTGGQMLITNNFLGIGTSPAQGNYLAVQLNPEFVLDQTSGHVGETLSRSELLNDRATVWPSNFSLLPESPIKLPATNTELNNIYFNFYLFKNNKAKGLVYAYLYNDDLPLAKQFRFNVDVAAGNGEWVLVSIPARQFKDGFGYGVAMRAIDFAKINKIKFAFAHSDKSENQKPPAVDDVQFYVDHLIITQGGPYIGYPVEN